MSVVSIIGGDHGGGRFWMLFKIIFRFSSKESTTHRYEIAHVSHSKDDINILKVIVLEKVTVGFKGLLVVICLLPNLSKMMEGLFLSFDKAEHQEGENKCNVPCELFINGDIKYFAQLLGHDWMSSFWCMWCQSHPSNWKHNRSNKNLWTIDLQKDFCHKKSRGEQKEPRDINGIATLPVYNFVEPYHYIFLLRDRRPSGKDRRLQEIGS
jgi:hypothetical protein